VFIPNINKKRERFPMKKLLSLLLIICSIGVAYADDKSTVTSLKYVTDELNTRQDKFGANDGKAMTFTNVAGGNLPRDVKASLGTSTTDSGLPTVSAVNTGLENKQDEIGAVNTNTVVTYTGTPGTLGQKGIYQDTGTYATQSDNLIKASTFNAALRNGLENEFVCADRDPVSNQCWLWTIHNEENVGKNLFDKNSSLVNGYINSSGAITSGGQLKISPFIEIKPNTTYTLSGTGDVKALTYDRYAYTYTAEQTPIAQVPSQTGGASATFTTAQNAKYIRIQMTTDAVNTCQLELGSTATPYEPYNSNSIQVPGKNLFDVNTMLVEKKAVRAGAVSADKPLGSEMDNDNWNCTDYISVLPDTTYTYTIPRSTSAAAAGTVFYSDKSVDGAISGITQSSSLTRTFTTPPNCRYVRFSWVRGNGNDVQLELGSTATPYEPYVGETVNVYIPQNQ